MIYDIPVTGDYCAIEIYEYDSFKQVGEFFGRLGSLTKFSDIVKDIIIYLCEQTNNRVVVGIESNSIGSAIIENLENSISTNNVFDPKNNSFDFTKYLYVDSSQKDQYKYGIYTNMKTKDQMISIFYDYVNSEPQLINSNELINQLSIIEKRSNGSVAAKYGHHDDLFMASCLCAYVKKKTILDPTYSSIDKATAVQATREENMMLNNILVSNQQRRLTNIDVFSSERELLKNAEDDMYDDFVF